MKVDLEAYSLYLPAIPSEPWTEELKQSEGAYRTLLLNQIRLLNLLNGLPERSPATPGRLGWLAMWVKALRSMDAARSCCERGNDFAIRVLGRTVFELGLDLSAVLRPLHKWEDLERRGIRVSRAEQITEGGWTCVVDRLCAYAAWCLDGDLGLVQFLLRADNQRDAWDPAPARDLASDPERRLLHEALFGPVDVLNEHELARDKDHWLRWLRRREGRIRAWLTHPDLIHWVDRLRQRQSNGSVTFFELLDVTEPSLRQYLKGRGLLLAYFGYKRASMLLHGSTLEEVLHVGDRVVLPTIAAREDDDVMQAANELGSSCGQVALSLLLLRPRLWPEPHSPGA